MKTGQEWLIDARGCCPEWLRDAPRLASLFETLVVVLELKVVMPPQWHLFPGPGGVTGLALLAESHLAIHTFPETGFAALNVYCCKERTAPDFDTLLRERLGATSVGVRKLVRGEGA
jgi:S-adenosylmethionine decarboxylase